MNCDDSPNFQLDLDCSEKGFTELNIRSLHSLIRVRPALARPVAGDLQATITRLLDEDQVSAPARRRPSPR